MTRFVSRLRGKLVHRQRRVVLISRPFNLGGIALGLRADDSKDALTMSPLIGRGRTISFANVLISPWQRSRVQNEMRKAGFELDWRPQRRRRFRLDWSGPCVGAAPDSKSLGRPSGKGTSGNGTPGSGPVWDASVW
jgi:hypothetical protein